MLADARVAAQLLDEPGEPEVGRERGLAHEPCEQVRAVLAQVDDPRREAVRMQADAHRVDGRSEQLGRHALAEQRSAGALADTMSQRRSTTSAGNGAWPARILSSAARTGAIASASSAVSAYAGA